MSRLGSFRSMLSFDDWCKMNWQISIELWGGASERQLGFSHLLLMSLRLLFQSGDRNPKLLRLKMFLFDKHFIK